MTFAKLVTTAPFDIYAGLEVTILGRSAMDSNLVKVELPNGKTLCVPDDEIDTANLPDPYTMHVETDGEVTPHGFHLGTDLRVAESFVFDKLRAGAQSVALRRCGITHKIYDWRDLPEYDPETD